MGLLICCIAQQCSYLLRIQMMHFNYYWCHTGVQNLKNTTITDDEIVISWDAASSLFCGDVLKYYVKISYDNGSLVDKGVTEQMNYTFNNLISNTHYIILVLANNEAGNGSAITMIVQTTGPQGVLHVHIYYNLHYRIFVFIWRLIWFLYCSTLLHPVTCLLPTAAACFSLWFFQCLLTVFFFVLLWLQRRWQLEVRTYMHFAL